jgi:Tol biopolymer transport system component
MLDFDVSARGDLVFGERDPQATQLELAWFARDGSVNPLGLPPREFHVPRLSPDGARIALCIGLGGGRKSDVWVVTLADGSMTRLTFDGRSSSPCWMNGGERVLFATTASGTQEFFAKRSDGTGEAERVHAFPDSIARFPIGVTPDGEYAPFTSQGGGGTAQDVFALELAEGKVHDITAATPASETYGALSPDGAWLAYVTDETGLREVYVQGFPERRGRWQVSDGGGGTPCWSRDGRELYFVSGRRLLGVRVTTEPTFAHGPPFDIGAADFEAAAESVVNYDVAPDGRFLVVRGTSTDAFDRHLNVVPGWGASLERER